MAQLRVELIKKFHDEDVNVVIRNSTLGVTFVNSKLNDQSKLKRQQRAQETALFIKLHYARIDQIDRVWVSFAAHETRFVVFNYTRGIDTYVFDKKGGFIGAPAQYDPPAERRADDEATARYSDSRNETDVQIMRLQLSGDLNNGIALVPHFTLAGNATGANHIVTPPHTVTFTFASYAPEKIFKVDPSLLIIANGKTIYTGKARNLSTESTDGNEFLDQEIPFPQFVEMTRADKVKLKLAAKEFPLTETQLGRLRDMANYASLTRR